MCASAGSARVDDGSACPDAGDEVALDVEQRRGGGATELQRWGDSGAPTHELNLKTIGFIAGLVLCLKSLVIASWSHGRRGPLEFTQSYLELMGDIQCLFSHTWCLVFDLFAMQ